MTLGPTANRERRAWAPWTSGLVSLLLSSAAASAGGFFDGVPSRGYVREDIALEALTAGDRGSVVARVRYLRLVLDPGRRDVALDLWPHREMLLVELASGERLVFERLTGIATSSDPDVLEPRGRIGLESGGAIEMFGRGESGGAGACAGLDVLVRFGSLDIPLAREDLGVPTVRLGVQQAVSAALSGREIDVMSETVPILLRAEAQGLPLGPLAILETLFPGRRFDRTTAALTFRVSSAVPLDPSGSPWGSITRAAELVPGVPAY